MLVVRAIYDHDGSFFWYIRATVHEQALDGYLVVYSHDNNLDLVEFFSLFLQEMVNKLFYELMFGQGLILFLISSLRC